MNKWNVKMHEIKFQNRWANCIVEGKDKIIMEVDMFDTIFIKNIVESHNDSVENAYEKGMNEGIKIAEKVYEK